MGADLDAPGKSRDGVKTFVLVHGAWHGGWSWKRVADRLRSGGHYVFAPTLTGLGERRHLMSAQITLDTFTTDVANVIEMEELTDIILVGHSFAGSALSGLAAQMPERISHLIYLDSMIIQPGRTAFDALSKENVDARLKASQEFDGGLSLPPPPPTSFGVTAAHDIDWLKRRLTPQPLSVYTSPLNVDGPIGNNRPCTYVSCTAPLYGALNSSREWARAQSGFSYVERPISHDAMITAPDDLSMLLVDLARS